MSQRSRGDAAAGETVWVRDAGGAGFVLARLGELLADGRVEVVPVDTKLPVRGAHMDDVFPAVPHTHQDRDLDDNCELMYLNEATLLHNVVSRYHKDKIYTYVANILVAVNPYKEIPGLYSAEAVQRYRGRSLGDLPPHVFAIADKAFRDMLTLRQSQSVIVSGESGAGKTESTKYVLRFLCHTQHQAGPIEQKILDANPILESFGNARTVRNNNSSRFGKFMAVHFSSAGDVRGGHIAHYLLEQSRLVSQAPRERNYHVFYLLCAGAPKALRERLHLTQPDHYTYLKGGCTQYFTSAASDKKLSQEQLSAAQRTHGGLRDPLLDDVDDFQRLHQALGRVGLSEMEREAVYGVVAAALHLGNVTFEEEGGARGGCVVAAHTEPSLQRAAALLGVDPHELRHALVARLMQSARGGHKGTAIMVPLKMHEATSARDALAKAVYSRLFDYIVRRINDAIPFQAAAYYIGILDIAGFEYFEQNSFEQFCINYCNEKLQQFFNERILKHEQELYRREGLRVPEIAFLDNQDCIELLESRSHGVFHLLDEESKLPRPDPASFTRHVHAQLAPNSDRIQMPRASRLKAHRSLRDDEGFLLRHFAGAVCYNTRQFIEKNNDALHASLEYLVAESNSALVQQLFRSGASDDAAQAKGKLGFVSVGAKFQQQLTQLMDRLKENGTNFVRCMKPNSMMVPGRLEGGLVLTQLQCSGTIAVLRLMEHGYPSRAPFRDLHAMYKQYLPAKLQELHPKIFCEALVHALGLGSGDFAFGLTRVFFRPGKYSAFDTMLRADPENLRAVVVRVLKWLVKARWRRASFAVLSCVKLKNKIMFRRACLVVLQAGVRGWLARRRHRPRVLATRQLRALRTSAAQLDAAAQALEQPQRAAAVQRAQKLHADLDTAANTVKRDESLSRTQLEQMCSKLEAEVEAQVQALQRAVTEQKNRAEQERLRRLEAELRAAEEAKRKEEERRSQEEQHRRARAEMEAARAAAEAALRLEEKDRLAALQLQQQLDEAARKDQERIEQERRDHELAVRLATETNGNVEGSPPAPRSDAVNGDNVLHRSRTPAAGGGGAYDLSKWKYSELRDTINTSCDIHLLEACRHEFHRRLKVYHAWKAKNARKHAQEPERAPLSIMEAARSVRSVGKGDVLGARHRYFRIPFVRPGNAGTGGDGGRGWWYAHFDGQYVARQMELHPDKTPVLLQAGVDDMQMCELSLEETGLTRKRGAEILQHEFEREWGRHGGATYTPR